MLSVDLGHHIIGRPFGNGSEDCHFDGKNGSVWRFTKAMP
jgi:hypothetical protein